MTTMNNDKHDIQKLLQLSENSISIKKRKLGEQYFKLKTECDYSVKRKLYLYTEEKKVTEELKKFEYRLNQKEKLKDEKNIMHMQLIEGIGTLKEKIDSMDSKQHLEKYFIDILSIKKKYEELQSIYDANKLEQETIKLDTELSMFESDIAEIFEQYQATCKKYENKDEDIPNIDQLVRTIENNSTFKR
ncbi:hypothetical protein CBL_06136 [Carabus blaptoides fortunei]